MASSLNGFQCPTTQVQDAARFICIYVLYNPTVPELTLIVVFLPIGVCAAMSFDVLGCWSSVVYSKCKTSKCFQSKLLCAVYKPDKYWTGESQLAFFICVCNSLPFL